MEVCALWGRDQGSRLQCGDQFKKIYRAAGLILMSPAVPWVTRWTPLPAKKRGKLGTWPQVGLKRFSQESFSVRDERWLRSDLKWNWSRWWRKKNLRLSRYFEYNYSTSGRFFITVTLQMTNPMLIMFFVSLFPQFIDHELSFLPQVCVMTVTYFCTVFLIHCGYGWIASNFRRLLSTPKAARVINCVGGAFFLFLASRVFYDMLLEIGV